MSCRVKRNGSLHGTTPKRTGKGKVRVTGLLRRFYHEDAKVTHKTLGNLSYLPPEVIATIRRRRQGGQPLAGNEGEIMRRLRHGRVAAVLESLQNLRLDRLLDWRSCMGQTLSVATIAAPVHAPCSDLVTSRAMVEDKRAAKTSLTTWRERTLAPLALDDRANGGDSCAR